MELLTEGTLQSSKVEPYEKASHWLQMVQRQQVIVFKSDLLNNKSALKHKHMNGRKRGLLHNLILHYQH